MRKVFLKSITLIFCLFFLFAGQVLAYSVNIDPPSLRLKMTPGQSNTYSVKIKNLGKEPIKIKAYSEDWKYMNDGSKSFLPSGTTAYSCANWLNINPTRFTLQPDEEKAVTLVITMPGDVSGGYYGVVFFESDISAEQLKMGKVVFSGRIGTILYIETEGKAEKNGELVEFQLTPPEQTSPLEINYSFKNTGNTHLSVQGTAIVIDKDGSSYGKIDLTTLQTLPGDTATGKTQWQGKLNPGQYKLLTTFDYGGDKPLVVEKEFAVAAQAKIKSLTAKEGERGSTELILRVANSGNADLVLKGKIKVMQGKNSRGSKSIKQTVISPGSSQNISVKFSGLKSGKYVGAIELNFDGQKLRKSIPFTVE